ncbi:P-loop containing nucleoside triphosphate hydrolase protein [Dactylonectria estremocensis]|uniref:P-loop containing nucleoside triphosphate hydrolase protein n=1 Tax=Dactylonectria estremocensis TaxID=1079267 RepID=A0A9P9J040_9HYPO|nr:P-loop containing nucleoside triphosphate hydrolase protein [Dactylonectria estremocensis]
MDHSESPGRAVAHSQFRDHANILQGNVYGDVHYHPSLHQPTGRLSAQPPAQPLTHTPIRAAVCVIPYPRNEDVVHRPHLVHQLNTLLPQTERHCSAALWGLGGSGKTQIALDYAYRRSDDDTCSVFWVHADSEATFVHDYQVIAQELGVDRSLNTETLLDAVCRGIKAQPKWVLIVDNADDLRLFGVGQTPGQTTNLYKYVPRGTVLWTSRDERIVGSLIGARRGIPVARMTPIEAQSLLETTRNTQTNNEEVEVATLLEELQWLPLAVSQAGAYMRRTRTSVKDYLSLLAQSRYNVLRIAENDRHRRLNVTNNVLDTWGISIRRLQHENTRAYRILHVIAYLDNQNIGEEILVAAGRYSASGFIEEPDHSAITEAITRLRELSFIGVCVMHNGDRIYEMHKLVQEATRYGLSLKTSTAVTEGYGTSVHDLMNTSEAFFSGIALQVISNLFPQSTPHTRELCEKYLAHAMRVGDWAELSAKQVETVSLLYTVSNFLHNQGRWTEVETVEIRVLNLRQRALGEMHRYTLVSMCRLAATYCQQSRYIEAEAMYTQTLHRLQGTLGQSHLDTIENMIGLAETYRELLRYDEAERLCTEAWHISREILGERHEYTLAALACCASVYNRQGRHHEAETAYVIVLDSSREEHGEKLQQTIVYMRELGRTYLAQGRYLEAESMLINGLNISQQMHGEKRPMTVSFMHSIAVARHRLGHHQDALSLMKQCWHLWSSSLGPDHPDTKQSALCLKKWTS